MCSPVVCGGKTAELLEVHGGRTETTIVELANMLLTLNAGNKVNYAFLQLIFLVWKLIARFANWLDVFVRSL